jgi:hypothetical protein
MDFIEGPNDLAPVESVEQLHAAQRYLSFDPTPVETGSRGPRSHFFSPTERAS